jgi:hypothetical protein
MLDSWSEQIAQSYLVNETDPTETTKQKVLEEGLNVEQAKRLCEGSNTAIRNKLTYELKDPQGTFPVIDWKDVVGETEELQQRIGDTIMDKGAALMPPSDWEYFEELMGDNEPIEKAASHGGDYQDALAIISMLKRARNEASLHRMNAIAELEKSAGWLQNELKRDVIKTGSINEAYTIANDYIIKTGSGWGNQIEAFFNRSHAYFNQNIPVKLASLETVDLGGDINPNSKFVKEMRNYLDNSDCVRKYAKVENHISKKIDEMVSYLGEQIREKS